MWLTAPNQLGIAGWRVDDAFCPLEIVHGSGLLLGSEDCGVRLTASDDGSFPELRDQFVRGDELHLGFPQADPHEFGLRLCIRGLEGNASGPSFELMVSIQTTWLDSRPTVDLSATGTLGDVGDGDASFTFENDNGHSAILLGPHDAPFTSVVPTDGTSKLRLFGQFLEKGVIRRARPWILFGKQGVTADEIEKSAARLAASPLPLA